VSDFEFWITKKDFEDNIRSKMIQQMLEEYDVERDKYQQEKFDLATKRVREYRKWFKIKRSESKEKKLLA